MDKHIPGLGGGRSACETATVAAPHARPCPAILALEIVAANPEFKASGAAWSATSARTFDGGNRLTSAYFDTPVHSIVVEMNGMTHNFELEDRDKGRTLHNLISGATAAAYPCSEASAGIAVAAKSKDAGLAYNSNPWNVDRTPSTVTAEEYFCAIDSVGQTSVKLLFGATRGSRSVKVGMFRDQDTCCGYPGTTEGIGMRHMASGTSDFSGNHLFYPAKLLIVSGASPAVGGVCWQVCALTGRGKNIHGRIFVSQLLREFSCAIVRCFQGFVRVYAGLCLCSLGQR